MASEFGYSEVSGIQSEVSSFQSGISPQEEQQDDNRFLFFVCCFIFLSALVGLVVFLVGFSGDLEGDIEDQTGIYADGGSGGGGGGGGSGPSGPAAPVQPPPGPGIPITSGTGPMPPAGPGAVTPPGPPGPGGVPPPAPPGPGGVPPPAPPGPGGVPPPAPPGPGGVPPPAPPGPGGMTTQGPGRSTPPGPATMPPATVSTTSTTTTTPPPLLCSVDHTATLKNVYPPDGLCEILIYTHVRVDANNSVVSVINSTFTTFIEVCDGLAKTTCGLSFDTPYTNVTLERQEAKDAIRRLPPSMKHLAMLNIYKGGLTLSLLSAFYTTPVRILNEVKGSDSTRKLIIGVGTYRFDAGGWAAVQAGFDLLLSFSPFVDIAVFRTDAGPIEKEEKCIAYPASAWQSGSNLPPTFAGALLVTEKAVKPRMMAAFTFEMGVITYHMRDSASRTADALYKPCFSMTRGDISQSCQVAPADIDPEQVFGSVATIGSNTYFMTFEVTRTMTSKATEVYRSPKLKDKFTWLLLNVHLTDFAGNCLRTPFERVIAFKNFSNTQWANRHG